MADTTPVRPASKPPTSATAPDSSAIYYEISPTTVFLVRLFNVLVLLMVVIAFILCLVQAPKHQPYYLLACNIVISSFVGTVVNWWYRRGDLGVEKYWYIILVGIVILIQTITTDIFVFRAPPSNAATISTAIPVVNGSTTRASTWVTISNTTNHSLLLSHTTHKPVPMVLDVF